MLHFFTHLTVPLFIC
uniref:Uncharacterized protein n=1 Tax=Rhizophora mucronata TaxID=61149 RepID=A0A2P2PQS7_RHIMU